MTTSWPDAMTSANCNMALAPLRELEPRTTSKPNRRTNFASHAPSRLALIKAAPLRCGTKRRIANGSSNKRLCHSAPINRSDSNSSRILPRSSIRKRMVRAQICKRREPKATSTRATKLSGSSFNFAVALLFHFASERRADWAGRADRGCARQQYRQRRLRFSDCYRTKGWLEGRPLPLRVKRRRCVPESDSRAFHVAQQRVCGVPSKKRQPHEAAHFRPNRSQYDRGWTSSTAQ